MKIYLISHVTFSLSVSNMSNNDNEIYIARFVCCLLTTLSMRIIID